MVLNLDDLVWLYERSKRLYSKGPRYGYDIYKEDFIVITESVKEKIEMGTLSVIPFINSYKVCLKIIDEYLSLPSLKDYKSDAYKAMKQKPQKEIVAFLWYFEHIDGSYSFGDFEDKRIKKIVKKWALSNGFRINTGDGTMSSDEE